MGLTKAEVLRRISEGQGRRRVVKLGAQKRYLGTARPLLAAMVLQVAACACAGCGVLTAQKASHRPDVVEIFVVSDTSDNEDGLGDLDEGSQSA